MKTIRMMMGLACVAMISAMTIAEEKDDKVTTVKCPVAGKEIKIADAKVVAYKKAEVYVCCNGCKAKMEKDATKFAAKANHQLFLTKQAKQVKCPVAGRPVDSSKTVSIAGTVVGFCCPGCQGKVKKADGDAQLNLAFSDAAFKKGFEVVEK